MTPSDDRNEINSIKKKGVTKYCSSLNWIDKPYLVKYEDVKDKNVIKDLKKVCLPSCKLKNNYESDIKDTFWYFKVNVYIFWNILCLIIKIFDFLEKF